MLGGSLKLKATATPVVNSNCEGGFSHKPQLSLHFNNRRPNFTSLSLQEQFRPSDSPRLTSTVGFSSSSSSSPPLHLSQWTLTHRHIHILNFVACAAAISSTWLFCSAIPTLLAFRKACESLEKLMDVTREELPDTMAAVRLSGMEISDLTMELSDLGQEITQGVRSSTRAVRLAEERLRRLTNTNPSAPMQAVAQMETRTGGPIIARTARGIREGIVKGRAILQIFLTITQFSKIAFNYFRTRAKTKA